MPNRTLCATCDTELTQSDDPWARGQWYDEGVLDIDNNGQTCPETEDEHEPIHIIHEALEAADVL